MVVKLLLLMNCVIFANCQSTISNRNDATGECEQYDDMKSEMESIRQLLMDLQQGAVRSETRANQKLKSEIEEIRQIVAQQRYWFRNECPPGFDYQQDVGSCYQVIFERMTWYNATERCRGIMPGVHLATITSQKENNAIVRYLQSQSSRGYNKCEQAGGSWTAGGNLIWIGGQTRDPRRCGDPYVWRPLKGIEIPVNYTNWGPNDPDCYENGENCLQITTGQNYSWNDYKCDWLSCAICELHM